MADISIIAAISRNRVIGLRGKIPWHLSEDLKRFKTLTEDHPVIMGRKTYESLEKALFGRLNIVISKNQNFNPLGIIAVNSLKEALEIACFWDEKEIFIIGGGEIYQQAIALTNRIYLTILDQNFIGDTFFPELDPKVWRGAHCSTYQTQKGLYYYFLNLEKNKADS